MLGRRVSSSSAKDWVILDLNSLVFYRVILRFQNLAHHFAHHLFGLILSCILPENGINVISQCGHGGTPEFACNTESDARITACQKSP